MKKLHKYGFIVCMLMFATSWAKAQQGGGQSQHNQSQTQWVVVSGTVTDKSTKEPLIQVSVVMYDRATNKANYRYGTTTNGEGKFSIKVPNHCNLVFSYIGYHATTYKVEKEITNLKIHMSEDEHLMNDVVIVGYEKKRKSDVTASAVVVRAEDLAMTPVGNVMDLLQGRVAGMNIQLNNGTPGMTGQFVVRGISDISITGSGDNMQLSSSTPLFVVDGIPQDDMSDQYDSNGLLEGSGVSPLSTIPVEDIASIEVLKDAQATSLYGSAGAYGVVLIETKRGNSDKPQVTYSGNFKVNTPPRLRDVLVGNAERNLRIQQILQNDTSDYYNGYQSIAGIPSLSDSLNPYWNNNTDWQDAFYRTTYNQTHNLSVSGGTPQLNYKVNGNYYTEKGIVTNTDFNRYGLAMNMGFSPNDKLNMSANVRVSYSKRSTGSGNDFSQSGVAKGASASSLLPPPSLYTASTAALGVFSVDNNIQSLSYDGSLNLDYRLPFNIMWKNTFGYNYSQGETGTFTPAILNGNRTKLYNKSTNSFRIYVRSTGTYNTKLWIFNLGLTGGVEFSSKKSGGNTTELSGLASDAIKGPAGYSPSNSKGSANAKSNNATMSVIFNPTFSLGGNVGGGNKYIFTPSIRPESNSSYGAKTKWLINYGLGFKWNMQWEPFMKKMADKWLQTSAVRVSWGRVTKYVATRYDVWGTYNVNDLTYNGSAYIPVSLDKLPNIALDPVTTTQWNLGYDLDIFRGKLSFSVDAYYKQVDNQLSTIDLPNHSGFTKMKSTETSLVNYGLEFQVGSRPMPVNSPFYMYAAFSMALNRTNITKLPNDVRQIYNDDRTVVNRLGTNALNNFVLVNKGVYATDEDVPVDPATGKRLHVGDGTKEEQYFKAGDPIWVDVNGDYVIDDKDKVMVGNSQPKVTGGFSLNLRYKNFSVNTNTSFVLGRDIINKALSDKFKMYNSPLSKKLEENGALSPIDAYDFWTPDHTNAKYPNPFDYTRSGTIDPYRPDQTLFMEDGSYFKIQTISVAYKFGKRVTNWLRINTLSVNATVNNVWTFSKYSGINPEGVNSLGYDTSGGYPNARSYTCGVVITL